MGNFTAPVNGDHSAMAYVEFPVNVRDALFNEITSTERWPTDQTIKENQIREELLRIVTPFQRLTSDHQNLLNNTIKEAAKRDIWNTINNSPSTFYQDVAQIVNFITINNRENR